MCRDHVNDDDVDVAIATMLESFINSQKHAVKMALRKTFRSYIVRPEDNFGLILYQLTELVREKMLALQLNSTEDYQGTITITIPVRELEEKVQQMGISRRTSSRTMRGKRRYRACSWAMRRNKDFCALGVVWLKNGYMFRRTKR